MILVSGVMRVTFHELLIGMAPWIHDIMQSVPLLNLLGRGEYWYESCVSGRCSSRMYGTMTNDNICSPQFPDLRWINGEQSAPEQFLCWYSMVDRTHTNTHIYPETGTRYIKGENHEDGNIITAGVNSRINCWTLFISCITHCSIKHCNSHWKSGIMQARQTMLWRCFDIGEAHWSRHKHIKQQNSLRELRTIYQVGFQPELPRLTVCVMHNVTWYHKVNRYIQSGILKRTLASLWLSRCVALALIRGYKHQARKCLLIEHRSNQIWGKSYPLVYYIYRNNHNISVQVILLVLTVMVANDSEKCAIKQTWS